MKKYVPCLLLTVVSFLFFIQCEEAKRKKTTLSPRIKSTAKLVSPNNGTFFTIGEIINFKLTSNSAAIDSLSLLSKNKIIATSKNDSLTWNTSQEKTGIHQFTIATYLSSEKVEYKRVNITLRSDITPNKYSYRIRNTYPHDPTAYTQGLLVKDGRMYESTGQRGSSTLREVDVTTGKVTRAIGIESRFFGEGISTVGNHIYFLTWESRKGIVYNLNTFQEVRKFNYSTEGWGLTTKADTLIMSDGTHYLRFMTVENFTEVKKLEVYDQYGAIDRLNELEYVEGKIYANRYLTNEIYIIDALSGKVTGIVDLTGIFDPTTYSKPVDVLNGIAYNKANGTLFVTGKNWPYLYEIQLISKDNI